MGSFSIWHWIIVLIVLAIPVGIGLAIWLAIRSTKKPAAASKPTVPQTVKKSQHSSAEARLQELALLRSKGLITYSEHEQQRSTVLRSV